MSAETKIRIVHPHTPETAALAKHLERKLLTFRIPAGIRKKKGIKSVSEVPEDWLIVLCTPETPENREVLDAIEDFRAQGRIRQILTLLVSGTPEESFPPELTREVMEDGTVVDREPLAANVSASTENERRRKLRVEKLRLLAPVLGVTFDDLRNRRRKKRMRILLSTGAAVLAVVTAFLIYALNRVGILSAQRQELNAQLAAEQEALAEADAQRNTAEQEYARQIAEEARKELEDYRSETALLLCMDLLERGIRNDELQKVLREALEAVSAQGYVPMDKVKRFDMAMAPTEKEQIAADCFPYQMNVKIPEDADTEAGYLLFRRHNHAADGSVGYYYAYCKNRNNETVDFCYFHFPADPEKDYFFRDKEGRYAMVNWEVFLPDGTFVACDEYKKDEKEYYRVKTETGEILPFLKDRDVTLSDYSKFRTFDGSDLVFGMSSAHIDLFGVSPFRYLESVYGVSDLDVFNGTNIAYEAKERLQVFMLNPFRKLYSIEQRGEYNPKQADAVETEPGKGFLQYGLRVFDLYTGGMLTDINERFERVQQCSDFSSDGFLLIRLENTVVVWDQNRQEIREEMQALSAGFCGPRDAESKRCSAERIETSDGTWWLWREEAVPVPDALEDQMALAGQILGDTALTSAEREAYNLD